MLPANMHAHTHADTPLVTFCSLFLQLVRASQEICVCDTQTIAHERMDSHMFSLFVTGVACRSGHPEQRHAVSARRLHRPVAAQ